MSGDIGQYPPRADTCQGGSFLATYGQVVAMWLREAMRKAGWTNKRALERESGVGHSALYDALSGEGNPSPETVAALAKALNQDGPRFALDDTQNPEDVSGLIGQAQAALDRAARLLRDQATKPGSAGRALADDAAARQSQVSGTRPPPAKKGARRAS